MDTSVNDLGAPPSSGPRVSICVTAYNHEPFIRQCLQSLVDQQSQWPFEILVGEDCSTDATRAIVQEFARDHPTVVKAMLPERNLGMFANYRAVHAAARGEFVCHCDGDDSWEPGKLQAEIEFLDAHPGCVAVFSNSHVISAEGIRIGLFSSGVHTTFDMSCLIRDGNFLHHSSMMYRRQWQAVAIPAEGPFIDFQIYVRLVRQGLLGYIDRPLTSYRAQSSASAIQQDNGGVRRLVWQALQEVTPADAPTQAIRHSHAAFLAEAAYHALRSGRPKQYLDWLDLVRKKDRNAALLTQLSALSILLAGLCRKLAFRLKVRSGQARSDSRVFYPK